MDEIADAAMTAAENDRSWRCPGQNCPNSYVGERGAFELFDHMKVHVADDALSVLTELVALPSFATAASMSDGPLNDLYERARHIVERNAQ